MEVYRFRSKARVVAIVDLILSSMSLCICLILLLGAVVLSSAPVKDDDVDGEYGTEKYIPEQSKKALVTALWILVIFTSIATIIQILAAIKLLNATQLGKEPVGALKLCVFWRHVCIVFTILLSLGIFFNRMDGASTIFTIIQVLLRAWAIYIVTQFMKELDEAVTTGVLPTHCQNGATPIIAGVTYAYMGSNQPRPPQTGPGYNPEFNVAPPSYNEVVKEPPQTKE